MTRHLLASLPTEGITEQRSGKTKKTREVEKRSTSSLNRTIRVMNSEQAVEGAPITGPEDIIPIACPP